MIFPSSREKEHASVWGPTIKTSLCFQVQILLGLFFQVSLFAHQDGSTQRGFSALLLHPITHGAQEISVFSLCLQRASYKITFIFSPLQIQWVDGFLSQPCMFILVNYSTYSVWGKLISTAIQLLLHLQHTHLLEQMNSAMQHHLWFSSAFAQNFYLDKTTFLPLTPPFPATTDVSWT